MRRLAAWLLGCLLLAAMPARAEMVTVHDDAGREVRVPAAPRRIVSLDDAGLTVPLLELGAIPVASQGRLGAGGQPIIRGALSLTGLDFSEAEIGFLGMAPVDAEAIAAARPDLILTPASGATPVAQLQRIAPTVVIDDTAHAPAGIYALLARLTGRQPQAVRLERRYQAQIAELRRSYRPERFSVSILSATSDGKLSLEHTYGSLGVVLRDAGFRIPAVYDTIPPNRAVTLSPELLQAIDADIILDTYRNDRRETPAAARRRMEALHPDYCRFLRACREGRYLVLPRDEAKALSYQSRSLAIGMLIGILAADVGR
jgi:iron complex transport system substrate-binding protein